MSPKKKTLGDGLTERTSSRGSKVTLSEVKLVENVSKNLQSFLEISLVQKEVLLSFT